MQAQARRHRLEAARPALPFWPMQGVDQDQEPGEPGRSPRSKTEHGEDVRYRGGRLKLGSHFETERSYGLVLDPIFLAQRLGLLGAAERIECVGSNSGGELGPGMDCAEQLLANCQGALIDWPQSGEVALDLHRIGMLGAEHLLANPQRALVKAVWLLQGRPGPANKTARLLRVVAVLGCSGPSTFSQIPSARS